MHAVEDVGCNLEQFLDELMVGHVTRKLIDVIEHLCVPLEGLLLKFFICVDLVTFCFQDPAQCFWVHIVNIALAEFEGI